jgi:hypothetical protein
MVGDKKNNESESESKEYLDRESWKIISALRDNRFDDLKRIVNMLTERIANLEEHLMSLDHSNEQGNNPDDGGWFD